MRHLLIVALLCLMLPYPAQAEDNKNDAMEQEVAHLFDFLAHSDCRFYRNGSWHTAAEAVTHLQRKYHYLRDKHVISSSEQFIERGASSSSWSGLDYRVQCKGQAEVNSHDWFFAELKHYREHKTAP